MEAQQEAKSLYGFHASAGEAALHRGLIALGFEDLAPEFLLDIVREMEL